MAGNSEQKASQIDWAAFMPGLALDAVIFGYHNGQLKILLLEYKNTPLFALPGGFIQQDEDLNNAAKRVLHERTALSNIYLEQFYVFGDLSRHNASQLKQIIVANGHFIDDSHWLLQRFISVGYYALIDFTKAIPTPDAISDSCQWFDITNLPPVMLEDHQEIIRKALETLQTDLDRKLIGFNLLPETFTMGDLQGLYETILGKPLLRPAFQRKMLSLGILERIAKKQTGMAHKAPYLYKFIGG
ncbi:NUDIX hydrolase [Mucilaginibacter agri]|uniref:NUDIX domain-containing protein n=1 Tax=Mucilaginibacter agri TaxID=2695265 RepID=A0A965ZH95_9SPHI|nr:NUDIX domain-containing protein [Mucilaginibacter agri]NCD69706.1 NUDIX domain-containing protein [Mucilaginibacter agri]